MIQFIVDAQLPKRLSDFLKLKGFNSIHTLELINKNKTTDKKITAISIAENRILITKDLDFLESYILQNKPSKLILIKTGNISNNDLMKLISDNLDTIIKMIKRSNLIEIHKNKIVEQ